MANKIEKAHRIEQIVKLISEGHSYTMIVKSAMAQWSISERQAKRYLSEANKEINLTGNLSYDEVQSQFIAKIQLMYNKAIINGDIKLAAKLTMDKLKGLKMLGGLDTKKGERNGLQDTEESDTSDKLARFLQLSQSGEGAEQSKIPE